MGSQLPNSGSSFQPPAENIGRDCPYQRGDDGFDPSVRVAVLEKELHHCREEKAVTELTVLYLASLHAKGSFHEPNTGHQEERLAKLTSELTRANEANLVLTAKLENAQALITALLTAGGPFIQSTSASQKSQQQKNSSECVDLIDLGGAGKESTKAKFTSDDTTLLDTSDNDSSGNEDGVHKPMDAGQDDQTEFSSFPDSAYIHHFISKKKDDSALCTSSIKTTVKVMIAALLY